MILLINDKTNTVHKRIALFKREERWQIIRKPTRYYTVLVSTLFCDRDIKRILNNQEYPATRMNLSSILINKWIG